MENAVIWIVAIVLIVAVALQGRGKRSGGVGAAGAGAIYGMLNDEKRKAVEIIVEKRAEAQDPEDRDGNLPDLAGHLKR